RPVSIVAEADEDLLPRRDLVRHARLRADREDGRVGLGRASAPPGARLRMDERAGRGVDLLVAEDECRPAAGHEIELLVAPLLGVLLDDPLRALLCRVRVRAARRDPEPSHPWAPDEPR